MSAHTLFLTFLLPAIGGGVQLLLIRRSLWLRNLILLLVSALNLWVAAQLYGHEAMYTARWGAFGFFFALRLYSFSSFILLAVGFFGFLTALFSSVFMQDHKSGGLFHACLLLTLGMANGAVLANDLVLLLFFWEGLLVTLFVMIAIGSKEAYRTAIKAFIINGVTDLCMLVGIALTAHIAHTTLISRIDLPLEGPAVLAFILLVIGAVSKAGSMPFHSWIPDAAVDAPLPFMALLPGALEKLVGIYFLSRITLDLFQLDPSSPMSTMLMTLGAVTIVLAVLMALIQKDFKRLLSFHAISQVGYMILGIGTAVPAGIVGGLFHMLNNAVYKSCLFLTGGAVEHQTGTTDLNRLGGLARKMPWTFAGFCVAAVSISGVPPFNGFFSKELIYDGALERGLIFYLAAAGGSFLTAASFLKLGHAAFLGEMKEDSKKASEAPLPMLIPVLVLALVCVVFGLWNSLPLHYLIQPVLGVRLEGHDFAGLPHSTILVVVTVLVLAAAIVNHLFGVKKSGSGLGAVDHIHYAPGLHSIYHRAEKRVFDPYEIAMKLVRGIGLAAFALDRFNDWIYNSLIPFVTFASARGMKILHNGSHARYMAWCLAGLALVVSVLMFGQGG